MSFVADVSQIRRSFGGAQSNFGPLLTRDRLDRGVATLNCRPSDRLALALEAGHERRRANGVIYDYSGSFVALRSRLTI